MGNLDNFLEDLGDSSKVETETATTEAVETPQAETAPELKVEQPVETTSTEKAESEPQNVPIAALKDERRKRQELERRLKELEAPQTQIKPDPENVPDFYEDPDKRLEYERAQHRKDLNRERILMSEMLVAQQYPDFNEVAEFFVDACNFNPVLAQQMANNVNPALFAYTEGKKFKEFKEISDPVSYKQKVEAEIRAKLEAEYQEKFKREDGERQKLGVSLTDARSVSASHDVSQKEHQDEDAFSDLFDPKTRRINR